MEYEWDEAKRQRNLAKHGFDFRYADFVIENIHLANAARTVTGEEREMAVGFLEGRLVTVIHTRRQARLRIISMRRARDGERRGYQAIYGG